ncbi:STAS domain-containing protein [Dokdonella sp.]|uniref:STAS domain-containing protein n=1 Tax=Dokdonella sp. TaxID=2291710 RepID=UPI003C486463
MSLEIRDETVGDILVLDLKGRLDTDTSADLELAVQDLLETGARDFIINLAGVGYVSSAGLRVLLMLGKGVDGNGSLRLAGLNPTVRQVFDVAGFTQLFKILPDRDAALAQKIKTAPGKPAAAKPASGKAEASTPDADKPVAPKPVAAKPAPPEAAAAKPQSPKPEPAKPAANKPKKAVVDSLAARVASVLGAEPPTESRDALPGELLSRVRKVLSPIGQ